MSTEVSFHWGNGIPATMKRGSFYISRDNNKMYLPTDDHIIEFSGAELAVHAQNIDGEQSDWNAISSICSLGLASKYFQLGDKFFILGEQWDTFEGIIIGIDHEGVPGITVMMNNIPSAWGYPFYETSLVWSESTTRHWLQTEYEENAITSELRKVIKPTNIKTYNVKTKQFETISDRVFALSQTELFGEGNQCQVEGTQYEYFKQQGITSFEESKLLLEKRLFSVDSSYMNTLEEYHPELTNFQIYLRGALDVNLDEMAGSEMIDPKSSVSTPYELGAVPSLPLVAFRI